MTPPAGVTRRRTTTRRETPEAGAPTIPSDDPAAGEATAPVVEALDPAPDRPGDTPPDSRGRPRGRGKIGRKKSLREPIARMWMGGSTGLGFVELAKGQPVYAPVLIAHTGAMSEALDACAQEYDWLYRMLSTGGSAASVLQLGGALYALVNDLIDARTAASKAAKQEAVEDGGATWDGGAERPRADAAPAASQSSVPHVRAAI